MAAPPEHPAAPVLNYQESVARDGVCVDRGHGYLRIIVPPLRSWRQLSRGLRWWALGLAALVFLLLAAWIRTSDPNPLFQAGAYTTVLLGVLLVAFDRLRRHTVIELTGAEFSITTFSMINGVTRRAWPRDRVTGVNISRLNSTLVVHVKGQDMIELFGGHEASVIGRIATELTEALAAPAHASTRPLQPPDGLPHGASRTALLCVAGAISSVGIVVAIFGNPWIAFGIFILAAMPVGIAAGTQKKDYYF